MDQPKQDRMLRLMKMMSGNINYTIEELSERLEMSPRTIYRYIDTFKNSGYVVNKLFTNVYKIESVPHEGIVSERWPQIDFAPFNYPHPQYLMLYGKNQPKCIELRKLFCKV